MKIRAETGKTKWRILITGTTKLKDSYINIEEIYYKERNVISQDIRR